MAWKSINAGDCFVCRAAGCACLPSPLNGIFPHCYCTGHTHSHNLIAPSNALLMPPKRVQAPSTPTMQEKEEEEKSDNPPTTPSPIKRRLADLAAEHKKAKRSPAKLRGLRLTQYLADGELVAFSVEGNYVKRCSSSIVRLSRLFFRRNLSSRGQGYPHGGQQYWHTTSQVLQCHGRSKFVSRTHFTTCAVPQNSMVALRGHDGAGR